MIETIYKTDAPVRGESECYVLVLASRPASGRKLYTFMLEHGQWSDEHQRMVFTLESSSTGEPLFQEAAKALYDDSKKRLAQSGFVHAFRPDCVRKGPQNYTRYAEEATQTA